MLDKCTHAALDTWGVCVRCARFVGGNTWKSRVNWSFIVAAFVYVALLLTTLILAIVYVPKAHALARPSQIQVSTLQV